MTQESEALVEDELDVTARALFCSYGGQPGDEKVWDRATPDQKKPWLKAAQKALPIIRPLIQAQVLRDMLEVADDIWSESQNVWYPHEAAKANKAAILRCYAREYAKGYGIDL